MLTNQITADPGNMFVADAKKPVGGNMLAHFVHTRVHLRKGKNNQRIGEYFSFLPFFGCFFSPPLTTFHPFSPPLSSLCAAKIYAGALPEEEATFAITEGGVADVE